MERPGRTAYSVVHPDHYVSVGQSDGFGGVDEVIKINNFCFLFSPVPSFFP